MAEDQQRSPREPKPQSNGGKPGTGIPTPSAKESDGLGHSRENSIKSLRDKELRMVQIVVVRKLAKIIRYPVWHYASHVAYFGIMGMSPQLHRQGFISVRRLIIPARMCLRYEGDGVDVSWLHGYRRREYTFMDGVTLVLTTTITTQ